MKGGERRGGSGKLERDSRSLNEFGVTEGVCGVVAVSRNLHEVPQQGATGGWGRVRGGTGEGSVIGV